MDLLTIATFATAFFVFAASPGPDNMTIVARTLTHGPASGIAYGLGTVSGILIFLALATIGLAAVSAEMGFAMTVLRYAGAAWLIWTGIRLWTAPVEPVQHDIDRKTAGLVAGYLQGVALNLGNPKMPLFYIALLPGIAGPSLDAATAILLAIVILMVEAVVIGAHVGFAVRGRRFFRSPVVMRRANRAAGSVMIGTAALALTAR